jgi:hypothetical protein
LQQGKEISGEPPGIDRDKTGNGMKWYAGKTVEREMIEACAGDWCHHLAK